MQIHLTTQECRGCAVEEWAAEKEAKVVAAAAAAAEGEEENEDTNKKDSKKKKTGKNGKKLVRNKQPVS